MSKEKLQAIADRMIDFANQYPRLNTNDQPITLYRTVLERGLMMTLYKNTSGYYLSLGRQGVEPSPKEVGICRSVFRVPSAAKSSSVEIGGHYFVRFKWRPEPEQTPLFEMPEQRPTHNYSERVQ